MTRADVNWGTGGQKEGGGLGCPWLLARLVLLVVAVLLAGGGS